MHTQLQGIESILKMVQIVNHRNKFTTRLHSFWTPTSKQCNGSQPDVPTVSDEKVCPRQVLAKQEILNDVSKKSLLDNVFQVEEGFTFSTEQLHGCFRSFNFKLWTKQYPFLVYSRNMDSVFCLSCVLLATSSAFLFNNIPGFSKWRKTGEKTEEHDNTSTQKESMSKLEDFKA